MDYAKIFVDKEVASIHAEKINAIERAFKCTLQSANKRSLSFKLNTVFMLEDIPTYLDLNFCSRGDEYCFQTYAVMRSIWGTLRISTDFNEHPEYHAHVLPDFPLPYRCLIWSGLYKLGELDYADFVADLFSLSSHQKMEALTD